ncbi:sterol desaturase family protein [Leptospira koniambonensis]|uniref:Sterol desaturase family protein n=2 Tax=Leptospira koniambonensis TaxID=2484950 RepID=A0A4R9J3P6_9LEPT|nr:sterol desaturase family protein [Leptospira koniambonensis]
MVLILLSTMIFLFLERRYPGRELPKSKGWYWRAIFINVLQLLLIGLGGLTWNKYFREYTIFHFGHWNNPVIEGLFYWFIGTFIFYWWHRLRHANGFWLIFHQIHHSPSRIEAITSFYKHPIEIAADSIITGFFIYCFFGGSAEAGAWCSFFGATGEYFYHSNIATPKWIGYFLQRPEHHSIHHQLDVHKYNYGDITWWDRLFGTFQEAEHFAERCGFPDDNEKYLKEMLFFRDVY